MPDFSTEFVAACQEAGRTKIEAIARAMMQAWGERCNQ